MAKPTPSSAFLDELATNLSIAYLQDPMHFVNGASPAVPVQLQSSKYRIFDKSDFLRDDVQRLGPGAMAARSGYDLSTGDYHCDVWALAHSIDDQLAANFAAPGDPFSAGARYLAQQLMIKMEREWAAAYFAASIWTNDITVAAADKWDVGTSDPMKQVNDGKEAVLGLTGKEPNCLIVDFRVHSALKTHPLVRDQIKHTSAEPMSAAGFARLFEVDKYLVAKGVRETANEGATSSVSLITGKHALLSYVAPTPSLMEPSAMYSFRWSGLTGSTDGVRVLRYPEVPHNEIMEINGAFDFVIPDSNLGYFFGSAVS